MAFVLILKPNRRLRMEKIRLAFAEKARNGVPAFLEQSSDGLLVRDKDGKVLTAIPNDEASSRVRFPSFWASVSNLEFIKEDGNPLQFQPEAKTLASVKEMIYGCIDSDPRGTAATYRRKATRDLLIGGGSFTLGVVITVVTMVMAPPEGSFTVMTGLLLVGLFEIGRGIYYWLEAAKHEKAADQDEDSDDPG
jgi:hypothetical protein